MSLVIGVDPGKTGALALLDSYGELIAVNDMPLLGKHVSATLLVDIMRDYMFNQDDVVCVIENVSSSPQMGVTSAFSFGRSKGVVEAAAAALGMRLVYVTPAKWKADMRLNKDKGVARNAAIQRWPRFSQHFKRVKDDGRAEAALIGLWWINHGD